MTPVRYFFQIIAGIVFGTLCLTVLSPALAAFQGSDDGAGATAVGLAVLAAVALFVAIAPTFRRSLGRGFLLCGVCFFALPLSAMLLSGTVAAEMLEENADGATAVGAGLAGMLATGMGLFLGLILGTIFTILGFVLALGGRREVVVVGGRHR